MSFQHQEIAEEYEVTAMPTLKLFKDGEEVGEVVGGDFDKITALIESKI
jgi:thiol-disulfide isomerase/thioredoxin